MDNQLLHYRLGRNCLASGSTLIRHSGRLLGPVAYQPAERLPLHMPHLNPVLTYPRLLASADSKGARASSVSSRSHTHRHISSLFSSLRQRSLAVHNVFHSHPAGPACSEGPSKFVTPPCLTLRNEYGRSTHVNSRSSKYLHQLQEHSPADRSKNRRYRAGG